MANEFLTVQEIARQTLPRLQEHLVFPNLCHKDFSSDFVTGKGATIRIRKPVVLKAEEFNQTDGVKVQSVTENAVNVDLDKLATVDIEFSAVQKAVNVNDLNRLFLEPAAAALAEKINSDGLALYKDVPYISGKAGTTPSALTDISAARKVLNTNKAPLSPRNAVWNTEADAAFTTIPAIVNAEKSGSTAALREGSIGRVFGLDNYMSQAVKTHKAGTAGGVTGLEITAAADEGAASVTFGKASFTGTVLTGDILTIGGSTYAATADAEAADNAITVSITPALKTAVTASSTVKIAAAHAANLAFHPMAFAYVTRPLAAPQGVQSYVTSYNGISLRVVIGYNMQYKTEMLSMDVLYGYKTIYPELAVRVMGKCV